MIIAPPWRLRANGYAVLFAPRMAAGLAHSADADSPIRFLGGFGLLLLLEYDPSDLGPYREALYIPGYASARVSLPDGSPRGGSPPARHRRGHSITWIVVSTADSRDGGIANWAIPKELGSIERFTSREGDTAFVVADEAGSPLLRVDYPQRALMTRRAARWHLPISSRILPHTLVQAAGSTIYETRVAAAGRFHPVQRPRIVSYAHETAEIASRPVVAGLRISTVRLRFPHPLKY